MHRSVFRRPIGILILGGVLAAPTLAAERPSGVRLDGPQALLSFAGRLMALWGENGSSIDPYGRELTAPGRTPPAIRPTGKTKQIRLQGQDSPARLRWAGES